MRPQNISTGRWTAAIAGFFLFIALCLYNLISLQRRRSIKKWWECKIVQMITMMITMFFPHHCIILMMVTITKRTPVWVTVAVAWWERLKWLVTTFQGIFLAGDHFPRYWLSFTKKCLFQSCFWQGTTYSQARSCQLLFFPFNHSETLCSSCSLLIAHTLPRFQLIGVVSFGPKLCGTKGVPGVEQSLKFTHYNTPA